MIKYLVFLSFFVVLYAKPVWIFDPSMDGKFIGAVGYAPKILDFSIQERQAILQAKGSLTHMNNVTIHSTIEIATDEFGNTESDFDCELDGEEALLTKEKDRYIDEDGSLYIWLIQIKGK